MIVAVQTHSQQVILLYKRKSSASYETKRCDQDRTGYAFKVKLNSKVIFRNVGIHIYLRFEIRGFLIERFAYLYFEKIVLILSLRTIVSYVTTSNRKFALCLSLEYIAKLIIRDNIFICIRLY
mgnify:CR=1 FL=1